MNSRLKVDSIRSKRKLAQISKLTDTVDVLNERAKRQSETIAEMRGVIAGYEKMLSIVDAAREGYKPMAITPLIKNAASEAVALGVLSDVHAFETVFPAQVNGLNEYNKAICRTSCEEFFRGYLKWVNVHRHGVNIPQFVLAILGDIITNQLHLDQVETNAGTPQEELLFVLEILQGGIDFLLREGKCEKLTVVCCDGNHGRATEKLRIKQRSRHSLEWLMYQILAKVYQHDPRVQFVIADGIYVYLQIFDKLARFSHGEYIRYEGGVGGLTIPVRKAIDQANKARRADLDFIAHWHSMLDDNRFIMNGSVLGYSEFCVARRLSFEPPMQSFAILDKNRWFTSFNRICVR